MDEQRAAAHYLNPWAIAQSEGHAPTLCCGTRWAADDRCRAQRWPFLFLFSTLGSVSKPTRLPPPQKPGRLGPSWGAMFLLAGPMWHAPGTVVCTAHCACPTISTVGTVYRSILVRRPNQMASSRSQMAWPDGIHLPSVFRSFFFLILRLDDQSIRNAWRRFVMVVVT